MKIIIGALALYVVFFIIGYILACLSDAIKRGEDEQKTWERIEKWRG